jgi:superfamily II DNA or RNA helicase
LAQALRLAAVIYCQPEAKRFSGEALSSTLALPEKIPACRELEPGELSPQFISSYIRGNDVPVAFHRESAPIDFSSTRPHHELAIKLEMLGRSLQYVFSDGLVLTASQILYHANSKLIPRQLLPLTVNIRQELRERIRFTRGSGAWLQEAELVAMSILINVNRATKWAVKNGEPESETVLTYFAHDDVVKNERDAVTIDDIEFMSDQWGPWQLTTALPENPSGVSYGRARLQLDPEEIGHTQGLSQDFIVDVPARKLVFHAFKDQLRRLMTQTSSSPTSDEGLTLHLTGHSQIQSVVVEIGDLLAPEGRKLLVHPRSVEIPADKIHPRLELTSDGSIHIMTRIETPTGEWEAHGLPQSSAYLLLNLQFGLGATTGYASAQVAHARRGLKRERDLKILKSLGFASLIFYDASSFALGLPMSDGTLAKSELEVCESLFMRLGSLILKSEGWPVQTGSLVELCSKNVTTLIEGFVKQVVGDFGSREIAATETTEAMTVGPATGRELCLYMPDGEWRIQGLCRSVALFFHALVADLAAHTNGGCFLKARTKFFENFMNGRANPDREDLVVRRHVDAQTAARLVYQPGINERYLLPESSIAPKGENVLNLIRHGFDISINGREVEEFEASDFRPEFTLHEGETEVESETVPVGTPKLDWFELHPRFFFRGSEISTDQASRLSREGMLEFQGKLYRVKAKDLPSLQRLNRFWASIQSQSAGLLKSKRRKTEDTYLQLPRSQTLELLALRASGVQVRGGPKWDEVCRFYDRLNEQREPLELPESFKGTLQPYQWAGVQWILDLQKLGLGGILADDMGLGKTVTSLGFLEKLRSQGEMGATLILVPTSLTYNWLSEAQRFAPELPMVIFSSREPEVMLDAVQKNRSGAAIVCTYGLLQEHSELFQQVKWNCIIFDEAQNLKNITTKRTTAARKLQGAFKLCLSGTPLENHYGELFSLFDLIVPGSLGDLSDFRERYVNPQRVLREDIDFLRLKTRPLLLRRTKSEVMHELPAKLESTVKLPFEEQQKRIYRDIATAYNNQVRAAIAQNGEAKTQLQMLTALLRLRQACSDPSSIPGVVYTGEPPKISTLIEALSDVTESGASALVFTQFLTTFERIRKALTEAKILHYDISGADSRLNREKKIRAFQEAEGSAVMLMTLKTGGVGLNLVKASYIFHIEPWWNPAVENQATDRAHRIGQTKTVQVYRYLIKDSVEEKIEILKDVKSKRFDALFSSSEQETEFKPGGGSSLTQSDFEYLLS